MGSDCVGRVNSSTFRVPHYGGKLSLQAIHIISPDNLTVIRNITTNNAGEPLTSVGSVGGSSTSPLGWNDVVFVEVRIQSNCCNYKKGKQASCQDSPIYSHSTRVLK